IGVIAGIGIHPSQRGKKISFPLLEATLNWLTTQKDVHTLQCDVFENNIVSRNLFTSLGFKEVDEVFLS
ncbi:MAG: GNAT family N-acetyltransferase, partial [Candidatus Hodarchaeales archaeon]